MDGKITIPLNNRVKQQWGNPTPVNNNNAQLQGRKITPPPDSAKHVPLPTHLPCSLNTVPMTHAPLPRNANDHKPPPHDAVKRSSRNSQTLTPCYQKPPLASRRPPPRVPVGQGSRNVQTALYQRQKPLVSHQQNENPVRFAIQKFLFREEKKE